MAICGTALAIGISSGHDGNVATDNSFAIISSEDSEYNKNASDGMVYHLFEGDKGYTLVSIGRCMDAEMVIPSVYKDKLVTAIYQKTFFGAVLVDGIVIPRTVTKIGEKAFEGCSGLKHITFKGTMAQWNAIEKGGDWNKGVTLTEIICSDGTVAL